MCPSSRWATALPKFWPPTVIPSGGDDFDERIINWMADAFQTENGIDLRKDKMAAQRLKEAAEKAKIELSSAMSSQINLPFITADATGPSTWI